jgi:8-oxo-dGTP pyrophosphatase MutT (NUDIX family)
MPDVYVFPGGRVDASDARRDAASELRPDVAASLLRSTPAPRARALAIAAVRETFEESGLAVGDAASGEIRPTLAPLSYVARAITPASNPIRYHARFFHVDAAHATGEIRSNGELLDLAWLPIRDALELNIIDVTAVVLREVEARLEGRAAAGVPLIHYRGIRQQIHRV